MTVSHLVAFHPTAEHHSGRCIGLRLGEARDGQDEHDKDGEPSSQLPGKLRGMRREGQNRVCEWADFTSRRALERRG